MELWTFVRLRVFGGIAEIYGDGRDFKNLQVMALMNCVTKCYTWILTRCCQKAYAKFSFRK
jgi:hypothetical protein